MRVHSFYAALIVDCVIWGGWSVLVGWVLAGVPASALGVDRWLLRLRPWEPKVYDRLRVRRWKRYLPDFGTAFGGRQKRLVRPLDPAEWDAMAVETRRAEYVHWVILLALPIEALVHGGLLLVPMTAYALIANGPCILAQRYNRARLALLADRRTRRARR